MNATDKTILEVVKGSLATYKLCVAIEIEGRIVFLRPDLLKRLDMAEVAAALMKDGFTEEDIIKVLEAIDYGTTVNSVLSGQP